MRREVLAQVKTGGAGLGRIGGAGSSDAGAGSGDVGRAGSDAELALERAGSCEVGRAGSSSGRSWLR